MLQLKKTKIARKTERTTRDGGHPSAVARFTTSKLVRLSPYKKKCYTCGDSTVNRSLIVMCEYIVNKSANGLGGKNRGIVYREKIPQFCI